MIYRSLNSVTRKSIPHPHWIDSIDDFGNSSGFICFISLNVRSENQYIAFERATKIFLLHTNWKKKTFKVITFGLKHSPEFHIAMIQLLRDNWILSFQGENDYNYLGLVTFTYRMWSSYHHWWYIYSNHPTLLFLRCTSLY